MAVINGPVVTAAIEVLTDGPHVCGKTLELARLIAGDEAVPPITAPHLNLSNKRTSEPLPRTLRGCVQRL
jgi:hypothetical protein